MQERKYYGYVASRESRSRKHLRFRDYMIAHLEDAKQYEELKKKLAEEYRYNPEGYTKGKDDFVKKIDRKVENWMNSDGKY